MLVIGQPLTMSLLPMLTLSIVTMSVGVVADEEGEGLAGGDEEDEEMWTMLEEFIKAMLMNLERLPADRIQEMLAMTSDSYDKSLAELVQHLQTMIAADVVTLDVDGNYALKRN